MVRPAPDPVLCKTPRTCGTSRRVPLEDAVKARAPLRRQSPQPTGNHE
jgi:hypothetical protein